jgi:hypothetical protein
MSVLVNQAFRRTSYISKLSIRSMSAAVATPLLVSPNDLSHETVFVDASWHMPGSPRNAREEYKQKHIAGARYLDLDEVSSEHELGLKHMMPSPATFAQAMGERTGDRLCVEAQYTAQVNSESLLHRMLSCMSRSL